MTSHKGKGVVYHKNGNITRGDYEIIEGQRGFHMLYFLPNEPNKSSLSIDDVRFESTSHNFEISELKWGGFHLRDATSVVSYGYLEKDKHQK